MGLAAAAGGFALLAVALIVAKIRRRAARQHALRGPGWQPPVVVEHVEPAEPGRMRAGWIQSDVVPDWVAGLPPHPWDEMPPTRPLHPREGESR